MISMISTHVFNTLHDICSLVFVTEAACGILSDSPHLITFHQGEKCVDIVLEHWTKTAQKKSS